MIFNFINKWQTEILRYAPTFFRLLWFFDFTLLLCLLRLFYWFIESWFLVYIYHVWDKTNDPMCSLLFTLIVIIWIWQINLFSYLLGQTKTLLSPERQVARKIFTQGAINLFFCPFSVEVLFSSLVSFNFFVFLFFVFFLLVCFVKKNSPSWFPEMRLLFFLTL